MKSSEDPFPVGQNVVEHLIIAQVMLDLPDTISFLSPKIPLTLLKGESIILGEG
jgi:hypothetical protein